MKYIENNPPQENTKKIVTQKLAKDFNEEIGAIVEQSMKDLPETFKKNSNVDKESVKIKAKTELADKFTEYLKGLGVDATVKFDPATQRLTLNPDEKIRKNLKIQDWSTDTEHINPDGGHQFLEAYRTMQGQFDDLNRQVNKSIDKMAMELETSGRYITEADEYKKNIGLAASGTILALGVAMALLVPVLALPAIAGTITFGVLAMVSGTAILLGVAKLGDIKLDELNNVSEEKLLENLNKKLQDTETKQNCQNAIKETVSKLEETGKALGTFYKEVGKGQSIG